MERIQSMILHVRVATYKNTLARSNLPLQIPFYVYKYIDNEIIIKLNPSPILEQITDI